MSGTGHTRSELITDWRLLWAGDGISLVEFRPVTGRTHQIRVHAAAGLGFPLVGDPVYGTPDPRCRRTMLHASTLEVRRGAKTPIVAHSPLPADFAAFALPAMDQWAIPA